MKRGYRLLLLVCLLAVLAYGYWKLAIPVHRADARSELVMLGDLDEDHLWTTGDREMLDAFLRRPFAAPNALVWRIDLNRNGFLDEEDLTILRVLVDHGGDPYAAEEASRAQGQPFPRPRELYRYVSLGEYRVRPLWALSDSLAASSVLDWLVGLRSPAGTDCYADALDSAIYDEAARLDMAWRNRQATLLPIERDYAEMKLTRAKRLFQAQERYELLLALIDLVEDAETLTVRGQPEIALQFLALRDHLREVLRSSLFAEFAAGERDWRAVLARVSEHLRQDLGKSYDLETLEPPRDFTNLKNYLQRAEWQYYKTTTRESDFRALIGYAQHDLRYLRAVSRTTRRLEDVTVENHNLPMVLLFREALRIKDGDKKKAVGLLDEAIRIPYAWIKSIPRESLPASLAFDNFLLPGNMEDGADKSRHWNVFGGICLYKSPDEALDLALRRELQDLRDEAYSEEAMREFLRDMIGNLNGMYHVISVDPKLTATVTHEDDKKS